MTSIFTPEERVAAGRMAEVLMAATAPTLRPGRGADKGVKMAAPVLTEGTVNLIAYLLRKIEGEPATEGATDAIAECWPVCECEDCQRQAEEAALCYP